MAAFGHQASGARGGGFGLDAELARQREAKYDHGAEDEARAWIETIANEPCEGPFGAALRDGVLLCKLVNCISPNRIKRINESRMPFKQMENVSNFLKACRTLGVSEHSLFETVDLFENKDIGLVVRCIFALGSSVQVTCPDFPGPHLGAKLHKQNKRVFNEEQKQQARINSSFSKMNMGSSQCMERTQVAKTGITFGAENAGIGDTTIVGKFSQGSHGIQERLPVDQSKSITFGAKNVGTGDTTVMTKSLLGSHGMMKRAEVSKTNSITFGAETVGVGDTTVVGKLIQGGHGIMERASVDKSRSITFAAENSGTNDSALTTPPAAECEETIESSTTSKDSNITFEAESRSGECSASIMQKDGGTTCPAATAVSDVVAGDSADDANRSWFQARSG